MAVALGGYLSAIDNVTDPWVDGLERVLIAPRYVRFGTWVRAYSYVNKYGTTVNVGKHWRDLPNKLMKERPVFAGIAEDSALAKGVKIAGRAGLVLTFVSSGSRRVGTRREHEHPGSRRQRCDRGRRDHRRRLGGCRGRCDGGRRGPSVRGAGGGGRRGHIGGLAGGFLGSKVGKGIGRDIASLF